MGGYRRVSRRTVLTGLGGTITAAGTAVVGGIGGAYMVVEGADQTPIEIGLYQTDRLYDAGDDLRDEPLYAADVAEQYLSAALDDLDDRADPALAGSVTVASEPVAAPEVDTLHELKDWWADSLEEQDPAAHTALLLDAPDYMDALGQANRGIELPVIETRACGPSHSSSRAAVVGSGTDLLAVKGWRDRIPVHDGTAYLNPVERTAVAAVHEWGHTLCLGHGQGRVVRDEEGRTITPMQAGYASEVGDGEPVYYRSTFSDAAVAAIEDQFDDPQPI